MEFNGFRSIAEYESECKRFGYATQRVPFQRDGVEYFALVTTPPNPTSDHCDSWHLFTADENVEVLQGVFFPNARLNPVTRKTVPPSRSIEQQLADFGFVPHGVKERSHNEQADQPERENEMKKYMGNYTAEAVTALKGSERIICYTTKDGRIFVSNGYFLYKMTSQEYASTVQPVTLREPGCWVIHKDSVERDSSSFDLPKCFTDAVKAADNGGKLARCPLDLDTGKIPARCYYNAEKDFVSFYNAKFIAALHPTATLRSIGAASAAVAYMDGEPFAMILPIRPEEKAARAVKAYFTEADNANKTAEADKLRAELAAANHEIAQLREQIAQQAAALAAMQEAQQAQNEKPQEAPAEAKTAAELIAARFADMAGVTATIKGAQTAAPVVWLAGDTEKHADAIKAAGAKWSNKKSAFYVRVA